MTDQTPVARVAAMIEEDAWSMTALRVVRELALPDWWLVAGFVRCLVWDRLQGKAERTRPGDIDVVFYDPSSPAEADASYQRALERAAPSYPWEVFNQAHMHVYNGDAPYIDSVDAFSRWAETVSTVGVSLGEDDRVRLAAPCGLGDLLAMRIRLNPHPDAQRDVFERRLVKKGWSAIWPGVRLVSTE